MSKIGASRILAIDLRACRFGYAVFETPHHLLDGGIARFSSPAMAATRVRTLMKTCRPSVLVLDGGAARGIRNVRRTGATIAAMRKAASAVSVNATVISSSVLRAFLGDCGVRNKYDFAVVLARWFPRLSWRVPPKRKCFNAEPAVMPRFDAIGLGAVYLAQHNPNSAEFFRRSLDDE